MTSPLTIERLNARYVLAPGGARQPALDRLLWLALDDVLEAACELGPPGEQICVRRVDAPVRLAVGARSDATLARTWADAIAASIERQVGAGGEDVVRYGSRRHALLDMTLGVATGDRSREWAWRSLTLWPRAERGDGSRAVLDALLADEAAIAPTLEAVARAGALGRLAAVLQSDAWPRLAAAALRGAGVTAAVAERAVAVRPASSPSRPAAPSSPSPAEASRPGAPRSTLTSQPQAPPHHASPPQAPARHPSPPQAPASNAAAPPHWTAPSPQAPPSPAAWPTPRPRPPEAPPADAPGLARSERGSTTSADPVRRALERSILAPVLRAAGVPGTAVAALAVVACEPSLAAHLGEALADALAAAAATPAADLPAAARPARRRATGSGHAREDGGPAPIAAEEERWPQAAPRDGIDQPAAAGVEPVTAAGATGTAATDPERPATPVSATDAPPTDPREPAATADPSARASDPSEPAATADPSALPARAADPREPAATADPSAPPARAADPREPAAAADPSALQARAADPSEPAATADPSAPPAHTAGPSEPAATSDPPAPPAHTAGSSEPAVTSGPSALPVRAAGASAFGGLVFGLNAVVALDLAARLQRELPDIELRTALHALALRLAPVAPDDPAALAFAGLPPDRPPPSPLDADPERAIGAAAADVVAWLAARMEIELAALDLDVLLRRDAAILADPGWIEIHLRVDEIDSAARRAGLDVDPGYLPFLGCVVRIVYA